MNTGDWQTFKKSGVVFDCNTFLQAVGRRGGPAFACLEAFARGEFDLYVSEAILDEKSLAGRDFCHRFPFLKIVDPVTFLNEQVSVPVSPPDN